MAGQRVLDREAVAAGVVQLHGRDAAAVRLPRDGGWVEAEVPTGVDFVGFWTNIYLSYYNG
jgi:hypothetical protein